MSYQLPLYVQVTRAIKRLIQQKDYLEGELVPSERDLAELYNVSRTTIKKAINTLVDEGSLYKIQGSGTYVRKSDKKMLLGNKSGSNSLSFSAISKASGFNPTNIVHYIGYIEPTSLISDILNTKNNVYAIFRTRLIDNVPASIEQTFVNIAASSGIEDIDFKHSSLYDFLERNKTPLTSFNHSITPLVAKGKIAETLKVDIGSVIFRVEYTAFDEHTVPIEYTKSYINPEVIDVTFIEREIMNNNK